MIRKILGISLCALILGNNIAHAFCTCWDSGMGAAKTSAKDSPGSHCAGGIDWDTAKLSHPTCKSICAKLWPEYTWAYVDQLAFDKCKNQNPDKIIVPNEKQKELLMEIFRCELKVGLSTAFISVLTLGILAIPASMGASATGPFCQSMREIFEKK